MSTAFNIISSPILVTHISEELFSLLEIFVILCYNRTSQNVSIDTERMELFRDKKRPMCNIPPSNGALHQKVLRSLLQAGWDWGQATLAIREMPPPEDLGWDLGNGNHIGLMSHVQEP